MIAEEKDINKASIQEPSENAEHPEAAPAPKPKWARPVVTVCILCTIVAWIALVFSEVLSIVCAVVGLGLAIVGVCGLKRSFMRDMSITCLIACSALLFVYGIFFFGLKYALSLI